MRSFRHWTPVYIANRVTEAIYRRVHPDDPWLTQGAITILSTWLKQSDVGLEFGSGRSTLWLAYRVGQLTSVEHNRFWYNQVKQMLQEAEVNNVAYLFREDEEQKDNQGKESDYVRVCQRFSCHSLDFVLVDGIFRGTCANAVLELVRPGGFVIIDNVNWFLPSNSVSPSSRSVEQGPRTPEWTEFQERVEAWRCIWTSNGVTDTAFYLKPFEASK